VADGQQVLSIFSTRDVENIGPACRLEWFGREWFAGLDDVRQTAEDLFSCAAYADLIGELMRIGLDSPSITGLMQSVIKDRRPAYFGTPTTAFLLPGGSSQRKMGTVLLGRRNLFHKGKADGWLTPDEAREMGRHWLEAAEGSVQDTLFDQVLRRAGWLGDAELEALFELLSDVRQGKEQLGPPTGPGKAK
jgi:hypothetical protein